MPAISLSQITVGMKAGVRVRALNQWHGRLARAIRKRELNDEPNPAEAGETWIGD
jgi:hypothetical protein